MSNMKSIVKPNISEGDYVLFTAPHLFNSSNTFQIKNVLTNNRIC